MLEFACRSSFSSTPSLAPEINHNSSNNSINDYTHDHCSQQLAETADAQ